MPYLVDLSSPFNLIKTFATATPKHHLNWTIVANSILLSLPKCSSTLLDHHLQANGAVRRILNQLPSALPRSASIGISRVVRTRARGNGSMVYVLSVVGITLLGTNQRVGPPSSPDELGVLALATEKVEAALGGPKPLSASEFGGSSSKRKLEEFSEAPRHRRNFVWSRNIENNTSPSALYTETAPPLPSPPAHLLNDPKIQAALHQSRNHIKVDTPFDVDKLERLLADHPNQLFVASVMKGLREGFWPLDEGEWKVELEEVGPNHTMDDNDLEAVRAFRDREIAAGRWSDELEDTTLLPGMKVSPMFVVWQNEKARVITDHSASGLNDGIPKHEAKVKYDDMHSFGQCMRDAKAQNPGRRLVTFKSDVAKAFLNLPAHPIWQLRQVVLVDGKLHIVRRLVFGNRASPRIWCAVSGLICWLGIRKFDILSLHVYMDDFFGWDFADNLIHYRGMSRPRRQVKLLILWEAIRCPSDDEKQLHGEVLKIIGFFVDINLGSISLTPSSIDDIISKINSFLEFPGRNPPLRDWQRLGGHLNWMFNVLPWGRPALTELYRKMGGRNYMYGGIFINKEVRNNLEWLRDIIPRSIGVRLVDSTHWGDDDADMIIRTDASFQGLSYVWPGNGYAYQLQPCPPDLKIDIFFLEMVAILSAIHHIASVPHPPRRLLIFTDSLNSVGAFNSLSVAESIHNGPLLAVAGIILRTGIDLRVHHIEGKLNVKADLLSRLMFDEYRRKFPQDRVRLFAPPRELLPARWRECF